MNKWVFVCVTIVIILLGGAYILQMMQPPLSISIYESVDIYAYRYFYPSQAAASAAHSEYADENQSVQTITSVPELAHPTEIRSEFVLLRQQFENDDIVGHLIIDGTSIDYFVTQGQDNHFYLYHDIHKNANRSGWVFLDHTNNISRSDRNTVIYAHNVRDGTRFRDITQFASLEFFNNHRYIHFNTIYEDSLWEVFAFYRTGIDFPYIQIIFPTRDIFAGLLSEIQKKSWHDANIVVTADDRILTLSTCVSYGGQDMRYVIHARLVQ